jgi:hypothetical protein
MYVRDSLSWVWVGAAVLLGIAGFFYQWMASQSTTFVTYSDYRNPGMASEMASGDDRGTRDRPM